MKDVLTLVPLVMDSETEGGVCSCLAQAKREKNHQNSKEEFWGCCSMFLLFSVFSGGQDDFHTRLDEIFSFFC